MFLAIEHKVVAQKVEYPHRHTTMLHQQVPNYLELYYPAPKNSTSIK